MLRQQCFQPEAPPQEHVRYVCRHCYKDRCLHFLVSLCTATPMWIGDRLPKLALSITPHRPTLPIACTSCVQDQVFRGFKTWTVNAPAASTVLEKKVSREEYSLAGSRPCKSALLFFSSLATVAKHSTATVLSSRPHMLPALKVWGFSQAWEQQQQTSSKIALLTQEAFINQC